MNIRDQIESGTQRHPLECSASPEREARVALMASLIDKAEEQNIGICDMPEVEENLRLNT